MRRWNRETKGVDRDHDEDHKGRRGRAAAGPRSGGLESRRRDDSEEQGRASQTEMTVADVGHSSLGGRPPSGVLAESARNPNGFRSGSRGSRPPGNFAESFPQKSRGRGAGEFCTTPGTEIPRSPAPSVRSVAEGFEHPLVRNSEGRGQLRIPGRVSYPASLALGAGGGCSRDGVATPSLALTLGGYEDLNQPPIARPRAS